MVGSWLRWCGSDDHPQDLLARSIPRCGISCLCPDTVFHVTTWRYSPLATSYAEMAVDVPYGSLCSTSEFTRTAWSHFAAFARSTRYGWHALLSSLPRGDSTHP